MENMLATIFNSDRESDAPGADSDSFVRAKKDVVFCKAYSVIVSKTSFIRGVLSIKKTNHFRGRFSFFNTLFLNSESAMSVFMFFIRSV